MAEKIFISLRILEEAHEAARNSSGQTIQVTADQKGGSFGTTSSETSNPVQTSQKSESK